MDQTNNARPSTSDHDFVRRPRRLTQTISLASTKWYDEQFIRRVRANNTLGDSTMKLEQQLRETIRMQGKSEKTFDAYWGVSASDSHGPRYPNRKEVGAAVDAAGWLKGSFTTSHGNHHTVHVYRKEPTVGNIVAKSQLRVSATQ